MSLKYQNLIMLSDCKETQLIEEGSVALYICRTDEKHKIVGKKYYLTEFDKGELILPLDPVEKDKGFIELVLISSDDFVMKKAGDMEGRLGQERIERWVEKSSNLIDLPRAEEKELLKNLSKETLMDFVDSLALKIAIKFLAREEEEERTNKARYKNEERYMDLALENLSNILKTKRDKVREIKIGNTGIEDLLFKACVAVGIEQNLEIKPSYQLKHGLEQLDPIQEIADASFLRVRKLSLDEDWYKNSFGPLVGFTKKEKKPVALIPKGRRKYEMYNPEDESWKKVTLEVAMELSFDAYIFYSTLPTKKLKPKDVLKFSLEATNKFDWITIVLLGLGGGLIGLIMPQVTEQIFDTIIPNGDRDLIIQIGLLLVAVTLTNFVFLVVRGYAIQRMEGKVEVRLQSAVWDRLLNLPVSFFKKYSAGELTESALAIMQIRQVMSGPMLNTMITSLFSIFYLYMLFSKGDELAWVALIAIAVIMAISFAIGFAQMKYEKTMIDITNELSGKIFGWLNGLAKIKIAGAEKRTFHNWSKRFSESRVINYRKERIGAYMLIFHSSIQVLVSVLIYYSIYKMTDYEIQPGAFIAFTLAVQKLLGAGLEVTNLVVQMNVIVPMYKKAEPIFETAPEYDEHKKDIGEIEGNIEINNINFRYIEDGPLVLKNISLEIKKGEHIALVGPSGSGKSTLFRLLLGFEEAESGQIFFDGISTDQVNIRTLRKQLGVVLQSGQLITGSIYDNITGSNMTLTKEDVDNAVKKAGMEKDITEMPMGLHTVVAEGASTLSGGQRQRLMIARAIVSEPKILFLDEATSALDNVTQKIVMDSINELTATRITIAHRLSTIEHCDRIIVLDKGEIVEMGTFDELVEANGIFSYMAKRQRV